MYISTASEIDQQEPWKINENVDWSLPYPILICVWLWLIAVFLCALQCDCSIHLLLLPFSVSACICWSDDFSLVLYALPSFVSPVFLLGLSSPSILLSRYPLLFPFPILLSLLFPISFLYSSSCTIHIHTVQYIPAKSMLTAGGK